MLTIPRRCLFTNTRCLSNVVCNHTYSKLDDHHRPTNNFGVSGTSNTVIRLKFRRICHLKILILNLDLGKLEGTTSATFNAPLTRRHLVKVTKALFKDYCNCSQSTIRKRYNFSSSVNSSNKSPNREFWWIIHTNDKISNILSVNVLLKEVTFLLYPTCSSNTYPPNSSIPVINY